MTDITCAATTCKYNSAQYANDDPGTCMLEHITLCIPDEGDDFKCSEYEYNKDKPYKKGD